jgi:DNA (cytosine-5)-methyltransferase 1
MAIQEKKYKVLDLFAGAGGFGLGFRLASDQYKLICSLEVDKWAVETLNANNTEKQKIIHDDIRNYNTPDKILSASPSRPDIIIGGPPCQGFSVAGPTKDPKDPRNSLFINFAHWVEVLQPEVFIMENVKGILTRKNDKGENVIDIIIQTFYSIGYKVSVWELNAANYGVPQNRLRVFFVGNKTNMKIAKPAITHYLPSEKKKLNGNSINLKKALNVIQAIGDLPRLSAGEGVEEILFTKKPKNSFQEFCRNNSSTLYNHVSMAHTQRVIKRYEQIIEGYTLNELPEDLQVRKRNGNGELSSSEYNSNNRHLKPNMVSFTIPASFYSNFIHPKQPRNITSREAARLQSFPDDYIFKGKRTLISSKLLKKLGKDSENHLSQYNQIGNAVPPLLAKAIANNILCFLTAAEKSKKKRK